ncbi:MAG: hypothetical protein DRJ66_03680 [Thermoprotei archaeon]|nr:MAG: hypothetical protein DRJ66_03680 [Thermoprotei archaeon]
MIILIRNKECDIILFESLNSFIANNTVRSNEGYGIALKEYSCDNIIFSNIIQGNYYGVCLESSSHNVFYLNRFVNNT